ncbi:MAG: hypothetical protein QF659_09790 [Dehalococcoidia bacterium]|nr:hypothetical protein [Dehalococcoidia bacterium]
MRQPSENILNGLAERRTGCGIISIYAASFEDLLGIGRQGPALVMQMDSTSVAPPGWGGAVDP